MKISMIPAKALTSELKEKWSLLQQSDSNFASPFFCPEFTSSLALYRDDIYVAFMEEDGDVVGVFPFRLGRCSIAKPMYMSDYEGLIVKKGLAWKLEDVLKSCGLVAWDFSHLIACQTALQKTNCLKMTSSAIINLSKGYEAYVTGLRESRAKRINNIFRQIRKIEQEVGTIIFKEDISDMSILHKLLEWKVAKYKSGKKLDAWVIKTLEAIFLTRDNNFGGMLSALYAGQELIAAHFGMRSGKILHWWFPAYNKRFGKYSPGIILLLKTAEICSSLRIEVIDFGAGDEAYKRLLSNDSILIGEGCFEIASLVTLGRKLSRDIKTCIRKTPYLYIPLKRAYGIVRRIND